METNKNKFLIVVDGSYFSYYVLFGAVSDFKNTHPDESTYWIKPVDECDQNNLPNLLNCESFKRILKKYTMKRLETIDYLAKMNFQDDLDSVDKVDIIFAMDDNLSKNFRMNHYAEYKAQRTLVKRSYQVKPIKDYITDVIFKDLNVENKYGYKLVRVEGAEGDDVIATALTRFKNDYIGTMLIASDHDFLQIEGIREFDLSGKEILCELGKEKVSASEFLLGKILMGDKSDNIQQVFPKCGPKTALKLVKDKEKLKTMLKESQESANRFKINKKIISFKEIPKELSDHIYEKLSEKLYSNDILNDMIDLKQFMIF